MNENNGTSKPTRKRSKNSWPKVRKITHPNGSTAWQVDTRTFNGERKNFQTKDEADTYGDQCRVARVNSGRDAFSMASRHRAEAHEAIATLEPFGKGIMDAVRFYLPHLEALKQKRTLAATVDEFIRRRELDGCSASYLRECRQILGRLCLHFGGAMLLADIRHDELERYLDGMSVSPRTKKNRRKTFVTLWSFATGKGYCADNVAKGLPAPPIIAEEPGTLTPAEMQRLLAAAGGDLLAYVAIAAFAGIRRAEIERLDWSDVDMVTREIDVKAIHAKSKKRRIVQISDTLHAWLSGVHKAAGPVVEHKLDQSLPRLAKAAKIEPWPQNCLRHSFASYHLAMHENAATTAFLMGHRDSNLVYSTYARAVRKVDALKFWALKP